MRESQVGGNSGSRSFQSSTSCSKSKTLQIDQGRELAHPIVAAEPPDKPSAHEGSVPMVRASRIDGYLASRLQHGVSGTLGSVPLRCGSPAKYNVAAAEALAYSADLFPHILSGRYGAGQERHEV